jgi:hypothetical protein
MLIAAVRRRTTYPLDTIKTQMQLNPRKYSSTWQAGCHIVRTTGPASLLNGLPASLAQVGGKVRGTCRAESALGHIGRNFQRFRARCR